MFATATTELIWHFAGYLRLPEFDYKTPPIRYDGQAHGPAPGDSPDPLPHVVRLISNNPLPGVHLGSFRLSDSGDQPWHHRPVHIHTSLAHPHVHSMHVPAPHFPPPTAFPEGGFGYGLHIAITATYHPGGAQDLVDIYQLNSMTNNNVVDNHQFNAPSEVVAANDAHAAHDLTLMLDAADHAVPQGILPAGADTSQLKAFVDANDADPAATHAQLAPYEVQPGLYLNGSLYAGNADPHQVTTDAFNTVSTALNNGFSGPPPAPTGDGHADSIETVSVGSNIAANSATLVNLEGSSVALAVQGNYYEMKAIVQTNVFQESGHIAGSTAASDNISIAANTIDNIADIQNHVPTLTSGGTGTTPTGLNWSVTVLDGSLLDIHSLVQTNYLTNNNVLYQTTETGHSDIVAGGNTLVNSAQFQNLTSNYDLIIVEGNYHQDDLLYQTNVILNSNFVGLSGDGTAAQSVTGGGNNIVNDGTIVDTGNHAFQPMTGSALTVIQGLENQDSSLDVSAIAKAFPELFGNISVLVVTGDYYDVNYVSQTNYMSNSNVVMMDGSQGSLAGASQTVQTGHDLAVNAATIYDGGSATAPYLQGQYNHDLILIQSNIVTDGTKITGNDPSQLVPELAAFTGATEALTSPHAPVAPGVDLQHHSNDVMASVLH